MGKNSPEERTSKHPHIKIVGISGMPEVREGDQLAKEITKAAAAQGTPIENQDIVVVTQKIVSKAEGRTIDLTSINPSAYATKFANQSGRDPRLVELVLQESLSIVRSDPVRGILITETTHGFICANAGIDASNVPGNEMVTLLPKDPDTSASRILYKLGKKVGVIISDTFGRAWREGHVNFAIGVAGMDAIQDYRGQSDHTGQEINVTQIAVADELASASELVMGKIAKIPVAVVKGYTFTDGNLGTASLLRDRSMDLFR